MVVMTEIGQIGSVCSTELSSVQFITLFSLALIINLCAAANDASEESSAAILLVFLSHPANCGLNHINPKLLVFSMRLLLHLSAE